MHAWAKHSAFVSARSISSRCHTDALFLAAAGRASAVIVPDSRCGKDCFVGWRVHVGVEYS